MRQLQQHLEVGAQGTTVYVAWHWSHFHYRLHGCICYWEAVHWQEVPVGGGPMGLKLSTVLGGLPGVGALKEV